MCLAAWLLAGVVASSAWADAKTQVPGKFCKAVDLSADSLRLVRHG
jgi:hypothetical protein